MRLGRPEARRAARVVAAAIVLLGGLSACGSGSGPSIADYCSYSVDNVEDLADCIERVEEPEVSQGTTSAAQYGRGDLGSCGSDAGPLCGNDSAIEEAFDLIDERLLHEEQRLLDEYADEEGADGCYSDRFQEAC